MRMMIIGNHQISPGAIMHVEGGYRLQRQTVLVFAVTLAVALISGPAIQFVLGAGALTLAVIEGHAYLTERRRVRLRLRDGRTLVLPCLSEREVSLTLQRVRQLAGAAGGGAQERGRG